MTTTITLPDRIDLPASTGLRDSILACDGDITFDAASVSTLSTPGLQVLLAAAPHVAAKGHAIAYRAPSPEFLACLSDFGSDLAALETHTDPEQGAS